MKYKLRPADGEPVRRSEDGVVPRTPEIENERRPTPGHMLLEASERWLGTDNKRWDRFVKGLIKGWEPNGWVPDCPYAFMVAWARANERLFWAERQLEKLQTSRMLTRQERNAKNAREADINFWGSLSQWLRPQAATALGEDAKTASVMSKLMANTEKTNI